MTSDGNLGHAVPVRMRSLTDSVATFADVLAISSRCGTGDAPTGQPIRHWRTTSLACAPIASPSHRPTRTNTSYGPGLSAPPTYNNRRLRMIVCSGCKHSHILCAKAQRINDPSVVGNAPVILCAPRSLRSPSARRQLLSHFQDHNSLCALVSLLQFSARRYAQSRLDLRLRRDGIVCLP